MTRNQRRRERIRSEIPIAQVLYDLGYPVRPDAAHREQQFPCDLHGDGRDMKPSARIYPRGNAWYCFAESKRRDAIRTIRDKFGLSYLDAIKWLEDKYGLPPLPFEEEDRQGPTFNHQLAMEINYSRTFDDDRARLSSLLGNITAERILDCDVTASFWEALDRLTYMVKNEAIEEAIARKALVALRERVLMECREAI